MKVETPPMNTTNRRKLVLPLVALALVVSGCAARPKPRSTDGDATVAARDANRADEYPLILRLVGRHYTVSVSSGPDGVVYSAEGTDGKLIVANASLDELRLRHPEVYQQLLPGIATKGEA